MYGLQKEVEQTQGAQFLPPLQSLSVALLMSAVNLAKTKACNPVEEQKGMHKVPLLQYLPTPPCDGGGKITDGSSGIQATLGSHSSS